MDCGVSSFPLPVDSVFDALATAAFDCLQGLLDHVVGPSGAILAFGGVARWDDEDVQAIGSIDVFEEIPLGCVRRGRADVAVFS